MFNFTFDVAMAIALTIVNAPRFKDDDDNDDKEEE